MKILFLQNVLFDYRVDFYNTLATKDHEITVAHCGSFNQSKCNFNQLILPKVSFLSIHLQYKMPALDQYDVVVSMFDLHWFRNILAVLLPRKNRFLFWGHGMGKNTTGNKLRKWLIKKSDGFILYNQQRRNALINDNIDANKLFFANNTINVPNFGRNNNNRHNLIFVGRLQARKRVDILIKAYALALKQLPESNDSRVIIIGDGEEETALKVLAQNLNITSQCEFLGAISDNERLKEQFDQALAYVSPGAMGLGVNHAFAYGVPTLSNKQCKHGPEIWVLNDENSLWIDTNNDEEQITQFAQHIKTLLSNNALAEKLGIQAFIDYQNHCSMEKMVEGFNFAINGKNNA